MTTSKHPETQALHAGFRSDPATGAVAVVRQTRHVDEAELVGDVATEDATALHRLGEHDVVDGGRVDPRPSDRGTEGDLGERRGVDVDERPLVSAPDRGAGAGNDECFRHDGILTQVSATVTFVRSP